MEITSQICPDGPFTDLLGNSQFSQTDNQDQLSDIYYQFFVPVRGLGKPEFKSKPKQQNYGLWSEADTWHFHKTFGHTVIVKHL